jgi:hypothetical protein
MKTSSVQEAYGMSFDAEPPSMSTASKPNSDMLRVHIDMHSYHPDRAMTHRLRRFDLGLDGQCEVAAYVCQPGGCAITAASPEVENSATQ